MKTKLLSYNLNDRARQHTGQDRSNVDVKTMIERINAPDTQELVKTGGMFGYYGHQIRQRFGMMPPETALIDGKKIVLEPAFRTVQLSADRDGTVTHQAEFLNNETGNFAKSQYQSKVGGFSTAVSYIQNGVKLIPKLFAGFDYVFQPNYATNVGDGVLLDGLFCSAEHALFDSINSDPLQAQYAQSLEQAILQNYDSIQRINALSVQNEQVMGAIQNELEQQLNKQQRYAQIKAKKEQEGYDSLIEKTIPFEQALQQANHFLTAQLNYKQQQEQDNTPNLNKMRFFM